jgi:starch synthase
MGQSFRTIKHARTPAEEILHGPKVLYAASEMAPLVKTGGLAEVAGSLPAALNELGCDVRVVLPYYSDLVLHGATPRPLQKVHIRGHNIEILETTALHDQRVWLVKCPELFARDGNPYLGPDGRDWPDNAERFALFAETIAWLAVESVEAGYHADIVHLNDWQTALTAALLHQRPDSPATVFSIHNLAYQGIFDHATFMRLRLPAELWSMQGLEFHGAMSFIKAGITFADRITTVSPTYAREIQTEEHGHGLDGLIRHRAADLRGILNGIDTTVWNPATDLFLRARYTANELARKLINKRAIQATLGLTASDVPLLGVVSRLAHQKGIDLILTLLDSLIALPAQIAVLGTGDAAIERALHDAARRHPGRVAFAPRLDESLAHQIEAGADIFMMPSRFEPCGLNQMYSQLYGTVPVVRRTGGLADTVMPVSGRSGTGFLFDDATPEALLAAVKRAVATFRYRHTWQAIQRNGMSQVFSWRRSAAQYLRLYEELLPRPLTPR